MASKKKKEANFSLCSTGLKKRLEYQSPSLNTSKSCSYYDVICGIALLVFSGRACFKSQTRRGGNDEVAKLDITILQFSQQQKALKLLVSYQTTHMQGWPC